MKGIAYEKYLLGGLDVQGHVSELFANAAEMMLRQSREGNALPSNPKEFKKFLANNFPKGPQDNIWRDWNAEARRFFAIYSAHGNAARKTIDLILPDVFERTAKMYGCRKTILPMRSELA